jgi:hypothetical protein
MTKLIGTAPNQVPTNADLGTMAYENISNYARSALGTQSRPASNATELVADGQNANGYYYINLGNGAQSIYCILDGSIESGYGYMRVWDAGSSGSGTTMYHFYTGESDNAAFYNTGGWDYTISEIALRTRGTWTQGAGFSNTTITRYVGSGGSGLHSNFNPKTFNTIFNSGWVGSGFETDNYKNFGYSNSTTLDQLYIIDDNDTPCGRQVNCTGTPRGLLSFGISNSSNWPDHGNNTYNHDPMITGLYVR